MYMCLHLLRSNSRTGGSQSLGSASDGQSHDDGGQAVDTSRYNKYKGTDGHRLNHRHSMTGHNGTLSKGQPSNSCSDLSSSGYNLDLTTMKKEIELLKSDLLKARKTIATMRDNEKQLKERLAGQTWKMATEMGDLTDTGNDKRPTALIRRYGSLYTNGRTNTLDALDQIPELNDADELKTKLLFTVIVLAFRSVTKRIREIKDAITHLLQMPEPHEDLYAAEMEVAISNYLKKTTDRFDIKKVVEEICSQIWGTLYDYPCLKTCDGLLRYIHECVKVAWGLCNQTPPFTIEYETRIFRKEIHVRFHSSNHDSDYIKAYLWPALLDDDSAGFKSSSPPPASSSSTPLPFTSPPSTSAASIATRAAAMASAASTSSSTSSVKYSSCVCVYKGVVLT
ncbi:hypothetical protein CHUAL_001915 [Chamberlinius hualienensis]